MPVSGTITITVTWDDGSAETYTVASTDAATLVKGDAVVKFHGTKSGDTNAKDWELTRTHIKKISYETAP
jgi:hypothetical protein